LLHGKGIFLFYKDHISTLATDLQSVAHIEAICNRLADCKSARYPLRIANPQRAWWL